MSSCSCLQAPQDSTARLHAATMKSPLRRSVISVIIAQGDRYLIVPANLTICHTPQLHLQNAWPSGLPYKTF